MQFQPKSREDLDAAKLIPKGYFDVECYKAEERESKKGNAMLVLSLRVYVDAVERVYTDYIVTGNDLGLEKLYSFCEATGQLDKYNAGAMTADDCSGKACKAYFIQKPDRQTEELRNELRVYLTPEEAAQREAAAAEKKGNKAASLAALSSAQPDPEDDVPF